MYKLFSVKGGDMVEGSERRARKYTLGEQEIHFSSTTN